MPFCTMVTCISSRNMTSLFTATIEFTFIMFVSVVYTIIILYVPEFNVHALIVEICMLNNTLVLILFSGR